MIEYIDASLAAAQGALAQLISDRTTIKKIHVASKYLTKCFANNGRVFCCGNGGSCCDAMHFAEELSGKFRNNRPPLGAIAISDPAHLTCTANDFGYEAVFSRFLEANARKDDILVAISTSGSSPNIIQALTKASQIGMISIALTGKSQSMVANLANIEICTPVSKFSDRIQELHIKILHILVELIERELFTENYN